MKPGWSASVRLKTAGVLLGVLVVSTACNQGSPTKTSRSASTTARGVPRPELVRADRATATISIGRNEWVNHLAAWRSLSPRARDDLIGALHNAEKQFKAAASSRGFEQRLLSLPHASHRGAGSATASIQRVRGDPTYTFGYGGTTPFSAASSQTAAVDTLTSFFIPCSSEELLQLCGGLFGTAELYATGDLAHGLTASVIAVQGYAAGAAGEDISASLPSSAVAAGENSVSAKLHVWTLNVSSSCGECVGYGASPSYVYADSPFGGMETDQVAGILDTLSYALPSLPSASSAISVAQAGYGALSTALKAPSTIGPCEVLTGAAFAQAVLQAAKAAPGSIPSASCQSFLFGPSAATPGWVGQVRAGQQVAFDVMPTAYAVDYGGGLMASSLFAMSSAQVSVAPVAATTTATTPLPTGRSKDQVLAQDKAVVAGLHGNCSAFDPPSCQDDFQTAMTPDREGNSLYAIGIRVCGTCGDVFYFFDGLRQIGNTGTLSPAQQSARGYVSADGTATFKITYSTYEPGDANCCPSGPLLTYRYAWNGHSFRVAGPRLRKKVFFNQPG